ncbi:hypothetical protein [Streptomyces abikoensis]|uniref:hypothetical protein n=1 Tax=Streptomyces abikoensis TaxID=97398 RepID=UPI0019AA875C|nr:hypothetical protein [Streptomyces abikoensis]GGP74620.1 hypothetical protein GCM10010214_57100 [Streptomyces abikoensis]
MLVKHMPRDSAVNRDLHGEAVEWDASTHLLAALVDHSAVANWMTATINSGEDAEPLDYPEPVARPGDSDQPAAEEDNALDNANPPTGPARGDLIQFFS